MWRLTWSCVLTYSSFCIYTALLPKSQKVAASAAGTLHPSTGTTVIFNNDS